MFICENLLCYLNVLLLGQEKQRTSTLHGTNMQREIQLKVNEYPLCGTMTHPLQIGGKIKSLFDVQ